MARIEVLDTDITALDVDAIANAANTASLHGGGVAGAISRAPAGGAVQDESDEKAPIGLGEAVETTAGDMPARWVIHAATMELGGPTDADIIRRATAATLARADELGRAASRSSPSGPASAASRSRRRPGSRSRRCGGTSTRAPRLERVVFAVRGDAAAPGVRGRARGLSASPKSWQRSAGSRRRRPPPRGCATSCSPRSATAPRSSRSRAPATARRSRSRSRRPTACCWPPRRPPPPSAPTPRRRASGPGCWSPRRCRRARRARRARPARRRGDLQRARRRPRRLPAARPARQRLARGPRRARAARLRRPRRRLDRLRARAVASRPAAGGPRAARADRPAPSAADRRGGRAARRPPRGRRARSSSTRRPCSRSCRPRRAPCAARGPRPARRVARRILQRLDGMGKWGGYHTDFAHLARLRRQRRALAQSRSARRCSRPGCWPRSRPSASAMCSSTRAARPTSAG